MFAQARDLRSDQVTVVSVVASGPSALRCGAATAPGYVIACNDMAFKVRRDAIISMDGIWTRERLDRAYMETSSTPIYIRRSAFKFFTTREHGYPGVNVFDCDNKSDVLSPDPKVLNGRHTGQCAVNLAFTLKPRTIFLYGFDLRGDALGHCHADYEWKGEGNTNNARKFREWAEAFKNVRPQFDAFGIEVINTNPDSAVRAFKFGKPI